MKQVYTAGATVSGGRIGRGRTSDGRLELTFSAPRELGGPGGEGTNPEQLFALAYAACFESSLRLAAQNHGKQVNEANVTANVTLTGDRDTGFQLGVTLRASVPGLDRNEIEELLRAAHETCPYSKAVRGNIDIKLVVGESTGDHHYASA
jgi:Ohr subfamily peroxiredoxin